MTPALIRKTVYDAAAKKNLDLSQPKHSFVVAKFTTQANTQGPMVWGFGDLNEASEFAINSASGGDVYVMSASRQHGLQKVEKRELIFVDEGADD